MTKALERAKAEVSRLEAAKVQRELECKQRAELAKRDKAAREAREAELKTQRILNEHLAGKTVESVTFDSRQEGTFSIMLADNTQITFSASGDDMTFTSVELLDAQGKEVKL